MAEEAVYYTPEGCVDLPFVYTYDANAETNGATPPLRSVPIQWDSDFILRAILGAPFVVDPATGGLLLYNYSQSQAFSKSLVPPPNQYAIVPEKFYPRNGIIKFQLSNILRKVTVCAATANILAAQLAFQGVKRYRPGTPGYPPGAPALPALYDPAKVIPRPWTYNFQLNLSWFHNISATLPDIPRTFVIDIQDYDFELHEIQVSNAATGARLTAELFQIQLYDATAKRALSTAPLNVSYVNANRSEFGGPVFPVPPILYPVWTQLRFDITSLVCNTDGSSPYTLEIAFVGVQRVPIIGGPEQVNAVGGGGKTA